MNEEEIRKIFDVLKNTEIMKELFEDEESYESVCEDVLLVQNLKIHTKFTEEVNRFENALRKILKTKNNAINKILFENYKLYLYKHILEIEKFLM